MSKKKKVVKDTMEYDINDTLVFKNDPDQYLYVIEKDLCINHSTGIVCCLKFNAASDKIGFCYTPDFCIKNYYQILEKGKNNTSHCEMLYCEKCKFYMPFYNGKCMMEILCGKEQHCNSYITNEEMHPDGTVVVKNTTPEEADNIYKKDYNGYTNQVRIPASEYFKDHPNIKVVSEEYSAVEQCSQFDEPEQEIETPGDGQDAVEEPTLLPTVKAKKQSTSRYKQRTEDLYKEKILRKMLERAKKRAEQKGWDFNLTIKDIELPDVCPILKQKFYFGGDSVGGDPLSPSLDRIDSTKGYVKGNVRVISHRANSLKNNLGVEELIAMGEYVKQSLSQQ